jgi:uroporphyrinogen III methyltransferase/synthase
VRLKGGDPFVFGRGGEEAEALREAGVPFEVVPGITAGLAAPACAGIPVTHRGEAVRVTLLTAHESTKENGPQVRWSELARDPAATLVAYMGVAGLAGAVEQLLAGGMAADTPAALIERGTTAEQRVVVTTLAELPAAATDAGIAPPAVWLVGPTARLADRLAWFSGRPLSGERVVVAPSALTATPALEEAARGGRGGPAWRRRVRCWCRF